MTFPMSVGAARRAAARSADAGRGAGYDAAPPADDVRRRADAVRGDAGQSADRPGRRVGRGCGAASRPARRCRRISAGAGSDMVGVDILDGIGSTEMLHIFVSNRADDIRYGTSGKPVPGYEALILDEHGGRVPNGEAGELVVRGPSVGRGLLEPARQDAAHVPRRVDAYRRHLHPRRRRLFPLLRPHRRDAEGERRLGLAVRGGGGAGLASRGAGVGRGRRTGPRRADQAQGVRRAAGRRRGSRMPRR